MQRRSVLIEVSPSELRAAVVSRGRIVASSSASVWVPNWKEAWPSSLEALAPRLRAIVEELGADSLRAIVFYSGPQAAAGVYSCPLSAGAKAAASAARLALSEATEFGPDVNPSVLARLAVDRVRRGKPQTDGARAHTLAVTDSETSVRAVLELAAGCGLTVAGVFPAEAVALGATVVRALRRSDDPGAAVVLRIGAWGCTLAASAGGRLKFVRQISLGTSTLATALAAGVRAAGTGTEPATIDRERACAMLAAGGIPQRGTRYDVGLALAAEAVLPLMQPILQRLVVEIRQSLRFGLSEAERTGARLICTGPGAGLPNLGAVVAEQCGLALAPPEPPDGSGALAGGAIDDHAAGVLRGVDLLVPEELASGQRMLLVQRGMWIGVAAACALGAIDGASAWMELRSARTQGESLRATIADSARVVEIARAVADQEAGVRASRSRLAGLMAPRVRWDALLSVLAGRTPGAIRLSSLDMRFEGRLPVCTILGHTGARSQGEATETIKSFMAQLSACPLVQRCQLGNARRSREGEDGAQDFEITVTLVGLPVGLDLAMGTEGHR